MLDYVKYIMKRFRIPILIATVLCLLTLPLLIGDSTTISIAIGVLLLTHVASHELPGLLDGRSLVAGILERPRDISCDAQGV